MFRFFLALTLLLIAVPCGSVAAPVPNVLPAPPRWEPLLEWLPEDTETLVVSPLGFEIPKPEAEPKDEKPKDEKIDYSQAFQVLPTGPLFNLKDELLGKELTGLKVLCVVEGSRRFTAPGELGMMPYEGCHILRFDPEADDALKRVVLACQKKADKKIEVAGVPVAEFTEKQERDTWTYFVCRPRSSILICATNREYLEETLKRIDGKPSKRALPADLPEWKHVDTKARVWAIRHYRKETAKEDPSSPLHPAGDDPAAVGLVFWMDMDSRNVAQVRYLSGAKDALKIATGKWEVLGLTPKIKQGMAGAIEISASIAKDETAAMFLFALIMHLGHGILL
jgi:hypothetical protein